MAESPIPAEFVGKSEALDAQGLATAADRLAVRPAEIWAVLAVETTGCGFLADRRPRILFERHIFSRLTNGRFDTCDVSNRQPGGYGRGGANQYLRLQAAIALDRRAALQSASWGLPQIMGMNAAAAGFADVESMVVSMSHSENAQMAAFVAFLQTNRFARHLQAHNWAAFARGYNGPGFAQNQYDVKLAQAFQKYSIGPLPDLSLRAAQVYLTFAGLNPGPVDGLMGPRTRSALRAYQQAQGLQPTGNADGVTLQSLVAVVLG